MNAGSPRLQHNTALITRALEVHISWMRRAVEPQPKSPRYLCTVRGKGYVCYLDGRPPPKAA